MSTVGSSETVLRILTGMEQTEVELTESVHQMRLDKNSAQRVLQREQAWRLSYERFSGHMRKEYPLYCDLLAPLLAATAQVNSSCSCTYISAVPFMLFDCFKEDIRLHSDPFVLFPFQVLYGMEKVACSLRTSLHQRIFLLKCPAVESSKVC